MDPSHTDGMDVHEYAVGDAPGRSPWVVPKPMPTKRKKRIRRRKEDAKEEEEDNEEEEEEDKEEEEKKEEGHDEEVEYTNCDLDARKWSPIMWAKKGPWKKDEGE